MAKRLLSLDIGITTGYAVFRIEPGKTILDNYGEIKEDGYEEMLLDLYARHMIFYSVAERPVIIRGELGDRLANLISITQRVLGSQLKLVDPAQWKSGPARSHPAPRGTSTHEKDAIRLGVWYSWQL